MGNLEAHEVRVHLGVMKVKEYSTLLRTKALLSNSVM